MRPVAQESFATSTARSAATWKDVLTLLVAVVLFRVMITSIGFLSADTIDSTDALGPFLFQNGVAWLGCDSTYYYEIIKNGYPREGYDQRLLVFFPGYPMTARLLTPFMSVENAMRIVPAIAAILATLVVFAWAYRVRGRRVAWITVGLMSVFPGATFLSAGLSDSLFLLFASTTFYCVTRRWLWLAALACAGATATRPNGLALAAMLGAIVFFTPTYPTFAKRFVMACVFGFIGYSSALIYQGVLWARFDNPKIYFDMQSTWKDDWQRDHVDRRAAEMNEISSRHSSPMDQFLAKVNNRILKPGAWNRVMAFGLIALTLAALVFPPAGLHRAWFVLPLLLWLLAQIPDGGMRVNSLHRFLLAAPMLWIWAASTFDRPKWRALLIASAAIGLGVQCYYAWMFTRGVWCG